MMEGYTFPNCAAAGVRVTAPGYEETRAGLEGEADDVSCENGRATVSVRMTPVQ